ncbi:unnamed protein product [Schistocephalus solidus]|uniref:YTH domain-containing protein n=1 Tax=Schistocephalus solidus TaxID=70667 RepID=A0A183SJ62_SCHSO|nr:unnamed protein product [Schistocephalus solidus]
MGANSAKNKSYEYFNSYRNLQEDAQYSITAYEREGNVSEVRKWPLHLIRPQTHVGINDDNERSASLPTAPHLHSSPVASSLQTNLDVTPRDLDDQLSRASPYTLRGSNHSDFQESRDLKDQPQSSHHHELPGTPRRERINEKILSSAQKPQIETNDAVETGRISDNKHEISSSPNDRGTKGTREILQSKQPGTFSEPYWGAIGAEGSSVEAGLHFQQVMPHTVQGPVVQAPAPSLLTIAREPSQTSALLRQHMATGMNGRTPDFPTQQFSGLHRNAAQKQSVRVLQTNRNSGQHPLYPQQIPSHLPAVSVRPDTESPDRQAPSHRPPELSNNLLVPWPDPVRKTSTNTQSSERDLQENRKNQMANSLAAKGQTYGAFNLGTVPDSASVSTGSQTLQTRVTPEELGRAEMVNPPLTIWPQYQQAVPADQLSAGGLSGYQSAYAMPQQPLQQIPFNLNSKNRQNGYFETSSGNMPSGASRRDSSYVDASRPLSVLNNGQRHQPQPGNAPLRGQFPQKLVAPSPERFRNRDMAANGNVDPLMPLTARIDLQNSHSLVQTDHDQPQMNSFDTRRGLLYPEQTNGLQLSAAPPVGSNMALPPESMHSSVQKTSNNSRQSFDNGIATKRPITFYENGLVDSHRGGRPSTVQTTTDVLAPIDNALETSGGRGEKSIVQTHPHERLPLPTTFSPTNPQLSLDASDDSQDTKVPLNPPHIIENWTNPKQQSEPTNISNGKPSTEPVRVEVSFTKLDKGKLKFGKSLAERVAHDRYVGTIVGIILSLFILSGLFVAAIHLFRR